MNNDLTRAEEIIESYGCDQSNLIAIMQEIQGDRKSTRLNSSHVSESRNQYGQGVQCGYLL